MTEGQGGGGGQPEESVKKHKTLTLTSSGVQFLRWLLAEAQRGLCQPTCLLVRELAGATVPRGRPPAYKTGKGGGTHTHALIFLFPWQPGRSA